LAGKGTNVLARDSAIDRRNEQGDSYSIGVRRCTPFHGDIDKIWAAGGGAHSSASR
jgi:hypothetical protein